jgi:hypothetical protein
LEGSFLGWSAAHIEGRNSTQANMTSNAMGKAAGSNVLLKKEATEVRRGLDQKNAE